MSDYDWEPEPGSDLGEDGGLLDDPLLDDDEDDPAFELDDE